MSDAAERLRALSARIERLATAPDDLARAQPWVRAASPLFRLFGWRLRIRTARLSALLDLLRATGRRAEDHAGMATALAAAIDELDESVAAAERAAIVDGVAAHGPVAGWLTRLHEVAARAERAAADPNSGAKRGVALAPFTGWALTSLAVRLSSDVGSGKGERSKRGAGPATSGGTKIEGESATTSADGADLLGDPRLVEIELAAIDRVLDAGRAETHFLGRRRRLFEAARKLLLDAAAAIPLDAVAVDARAQHIADEIVLINRFEGAGVAPDIALSHQALSALARGERQKLYSTLRASAEVACAAGDLAVATRSRKALQRLEERGGRAAPDGEAERSAAELLGDPVVSTIRDAYEGARRDLAFRQLAPVEADVDAAEREQRTMLWQRYLRDDAVLATLSAAVSVDGCFEVGGTLSPLRVEERIRRERIVAYPTPDLVLVPSTDAADLQHAVIDDPRGVILALAEGRLLARKFRRVDEVRTTRKRLVSEARIYVLDGSDSMLMGGVRRASGARARMRDAILLAELATLYRRATERGRSTRVILFYRYFTKLLGDVTRVESAAEALGAMSEVISTPRHGGTDIQAALLASFEQIREARAVDPDLARAQIVLVTDGEAAVDEGAVRAAREREGQFPIGVSVIALGEENEVLRRLAAHQRARGEPAFYHFVSDEGLAAIVQGQRAAGVRVHGQAANVEDDQPAAEALARELGSLVEEIDALSRARGDGGTPAERGAMGTMDADALAALGIAHHETEGERARREARDRDDRALSARFDAWFPPAPVVAQAEQAEVGDGDEEAALVVLTVLADVLTDLGGAPRERSADAVDLLDRLLPDARLSPARYRAVVQARPGAIDAALSAVRSAVTGTAEHAGGGRSASRTSPAPSR